MSGKLAARQKDSLTLNGDNLLRQENKLKTRCWYTKPYKLAIFCVLSCSFFLVYWIILGPLLISEFQAHNAQKTDKWAVIWLSFYWFIAFLIWVFVMLCLLLICKRMDAFQKDYNFQTYGTGVSMPSSLITTKRDRPQSLRLLTIKEEKPVNELTSDKNKTNVVRDKRDNDVSDKAQGSKPKRPKDLPPLVIHGHISGKDNKRNDTMNLEENTEKEGEEALKSGGNVPRSWRGSMQNYLKLVADTPDSEVDVQSPNTPLSPRELFFIDLIKEAERAEEAKLNKNPEGLEGKHSLPSGSTLTAKNNAQDEKSESVEIPITSAEDEATYFIANVDSPKSMKTEVFLDIIPDPQPVAVLSADLIKEKPILVLRKNSQDGENRNANETVIFEI